MILPLPSPPLPTEPLRDPVTVVGPPRRDDFGLGGVALCAEVAAALVSVALLSDDIRLGV